MKRLALKRNNVILLLLSCAFISALFAACDVLHPVAPTPPTELAAPPPVRTASLPPPPAPVELGSVFIGVPASTSVADARAVEQDWKLVGSFEDSTWILVEIEGGVTHAANPACAALPPFWRCASFPLAGVTAGPATPFTSGQVDLWENGAGAPLHYRPAGGDPSALSARALSFRRRAGSVSARRHVQAAGAIEPLANQPSHGTYLLSGGQTVRLRAIPPPLGISGPADLAPGETATYTAAPLFGLQLANPYGAHHLPPGGYGWTYHPDDTAAVARKRVTAGYPIWHCENQPTCDVELPRSGRLAVFAYVEDQLVGAYSGVIRVGQSQLNLSCVPGPTVARGDSITCVARATPAGAVVSDLAWEFTDSAGHVIAGPTGTDTLWGGRMAVGGTVKVRGKVDGTESNDSLNVRVTTRSWPRLRLDVRERGHGDLPPAHAITGTGGLAHAHVDTLQVSLASAITRGPNTGWIFLDSMVVVPVTVHVSDHWNSGNVWYNLQHSGPWTNPLTGAPGHYCSPSQLPAMRTEARRHEGSLNWPMKTSHADVFRRWVNNSSTARDSLEAAVAYQPDLGGMQPSIWAGSAYEQFVRGPMMGDPNQRHSNETPPGSVDVAVFPCKLRFFP